MTSTMPHTGHPATNPHRTASPIAGSWPGILTTLLDGVDLTGADAAWAMGRMVRGEATSAQVAGFLTALRAKGETAAEVGGLVRALYEHATKVAIPGPIVDIVGTGGDRTRAVNISTMAAVVVAATGVTVVKHGGRAASWADLPRPRAFCVLPMMPICSMTQGS